MRRCGLIGNPVEHSLSPVMQAAAFRETGVEGAYELWPTPDREVPARVASLRADDVIGANVTVPHKQRVIPEVDEISDTAARIGAVNTILKREGRLIGDNTDAYGFTMAVEEAGFRGSGASRAVVLGAGGASRAVVVALQDAGLGSIQVANRTAGRASQLVGELIRGDDLSAVPWGDLETVLPSVDLLVNATSLGWHAGELPLDMARLGLLSERATVVDLTYRETDLLRFVRRRGLAAVDGLGMLIHQGARAFELWTGVPPPVGAMRSAVEREQRRRQQGGG
jgi:shikimate dehydrogenase